MAAWRKPSPSICRRVARVSREMEPTRRSPRTTGKTSWRLCAVCVRAPRRVSELESRVYSVSMTSETRIAAGLDGVECGTHAELAPEKQQATEEDEPDVRENEAREHEDNGQSDVESEAGRDGAENRRGCGLTRAEDAARGHGGGRQKINETDEELNPDRAAQDVMEADPGLRKERDPGLEAIGEADEQETHAEVGERSGGSDEAHAGAGSSVLARGKGHDAADGKQKHSAEKQTGVERRDGAGDLANEDGEAEREPKTHAASDVVHEDGRVSDGGGEQKKE